MTSGAERHPEDPEKKIDAFKVIIESSSGGEGLSYENGSGGRVPGSSSSYQWITILR